MKRRLLMRGLWLSLTASLIGGLLMLDHFRGGPSSQLSRCNLLLSKSESPPADILVLGSSRSGTAIDPFAMQSMLSMAGLQHAPVVERMALGHNPLRPSHALLGNYLERRGAPRVIVLELMFMSERSVERLERQQADLGAEEYIFRRDLNLMSFSQILAMPAVAMPFSQAESTLNRWRLRLRGALLRAGALSYQFLRDPVERWDLSTCDTKAWTREPEWPQDFSFSFGEYEPQGPPGATRALIEAEIAADAPGRRLRSWQVGIEQGRDYPYEFAAGHRAGEMATLQSMLEMASARSAAVILVPLPLFGFEAGQADLRDLAASLPANAHIFDLYGHVRSDLSTYWYDDAHLEPYPAGALTTAVLAEHILASDLLAADR